jgi:hypothetical protein
MASTSRLRTDRDLGLNITGCFPAFCAPARV